MPQMVVIQRVRGEGFCFFYVHGDDGWGSPRYRWNSRWMKSDVCGKMLILRLLCVL